MYGEVQWLWTGSKWAGFVWLRIEPRVKLVYDEGARVDVTQGGVLRKELRCQNMAGFMWRGAMCTKKQFDRVHLAVSCEPSSQCGNFSRSVPDIKISSALLIT
jgi:hypothetical protein